ncbi:hypothetical protein [Phyllobacterium zundukense]|uniref:Uncharacterized protein n=1 Tax=Phyllobacterium zundukense TaxID=1867719 RepID=A0A2N9W0R6_9HYPH|nr:hypothetical protein [Phyllobacterium zundukense]ATU90399.1 hypothetical protein BLM14_01010 [Phyllobacterium zundukense]PIO45334.1 hypothetical protein B5P45_07625 [Phyllobacterium zundukense]
MAAQTIQLFGNLTLKVEYSEMEFHGMHGTAVTAFNQLVSDPGRHDGKTVANNGSFAAGE